MPIELIPLKQVLPNPWQTRAKDDPKHVNGIAESIKERGLLQTPIGRRNGTGIELAFGHSRFAAWQIAKPGQPFPVDVRELSDQQMAEYAITENGQRNDINPVERARAMKRYMDEFKATQAEAGKLFGLNTQGAVSNAVRLLQLPDAVLNLVIAGELAERHARQLVVLARFDAKGAADAAKKLLKEPDKERDWRLNSLVSQWFRDHGRNMRDPKWSLDWKPDLQYEGEPVPACAGCPFRWQGQYENFCARPKCFDLKRGQHINAEAAKASKKLGIPLVKGGEKVTVLFKGEWDEVELGKKLLKSKPDHLRLAVHSASDHNAIRRHQLLGSGFVALAMVDEAVAKKLAPKQEKKSKGQTSHATYEQQRAERVKRLKQAETTIDAITPAFAELLPPHDGLLELLWAGMQDWVSVDVWPKTKNVKERRAVVVGVSLRRKLDVDYDADLEEVREGVLALGKAFKVKLPAGWDTALNSNGKTEPVPKKSGAKKK